MLVISLQGAVPVHVGAQRHPFLGDDVPQDAQVAHRALMLDEVRTRQHFAGGVVYRSHQAKPGATPLEPIMAAAIPEDHLTGLRTTVPAAPMCAGPSPPGRTDPSAQQQPPNRLA